MCIKVNGKIIVENYRNEIKSVISDGVGSGLRVPSKIINEKEITSKISYKNDIDGLTDKNMGRFYKGEKCFIPCTALGVIEMSKNIGMGLVTTTMLIKNACEAWRNNVY